jgi:hypothetical protein
MSLFYHYLLILGMSLYFYYYYITCNGLAILIDVYLFYIFSINESRSLKEEKEHGLKLQIALQHNLLLMYISKGIVHLMLKERPKLNIKTWW